MTAISARTRRPGLRICAWCAIAAAIEVALYLSYDHHNGSFHWFTHFFVGASAALLAMSGVARMTRRPVPIPLLWVVLGHLVAMAPDLLFRGGMVHRRWMDLFLGHLRVHYVPGRNLTWYGVFLAALALYLCVVHRVSSSGDAGHPDHANRGTEPRVWSMLRRLSA